MTSIPARLTLAPLLTPVNSYHDPDVVNEHTLTSHIVPDSYIILLDDHLKDHEMKAHHDYVDQLCQDVNAILTAAGSTELFDGLIHKYSMGVYEELGAAGGVFKGYAGHFSPETIQAIRALHGVKLIELDLIPVAAAIIQYGAPWVSEASASMSILTVSDNDDLGTGIVPIVSFDERLNS